MVTKTRILIVLLLALVIAGVVIVRMPSAADCQAGGGMVDSTFQHCIGPSGTVTIREHVVGHVITLLPLVLVVAVVGGVIHHRMRSREAAKEGNS